MADHTNRVYIQPTLGKNENINANNTFMFLTNGGHHSFQINMTPKSSQRKRFFRYH